MSDIGHQDGIASFHDWLKKMDLWQEAFEVWATLPNETRAITKPPIPPRIQSRGPLYKATDLNTWPWPEKLTQNTLRKLKDYHDAAVGGSEPIPPPPPPPPPPTGGYPPRAYNMGRAGQNCRFNILINATRRDDGKYVDKDGLIYSDGGLCGGGRNETTPIIGLKPADMMDGKEVWEPYEWMGKIVPPYPPESYLK